MPITWLEDEQSRSATIFRLGRRDPSVRQRTWNVVGTTDDVALHADINAKVSSLYQYWSYPGQPTVQMRAESYSVDHQGDGLWRVVVNYEKIGGDDPTQTAPLKRARSFDTTGGTAHITQARADRQGNGIVIGEAVWDSNGPNTSLAENGAINVDESGVNGVDVIVPQLQWTEQYDVPAKYVTSAYIRQVHLLTGSTNIADFRGFKKCEVLFAGLTGSQEWDAQRGDGPWSLSYKFIASPTRGSTYAVTEGALPADPIGQITQYDKRGHEYLWVKYAKAEDQANARISRQPIAVYVNKVYPDGDFSKLGIGVA